MQTIALIEKRNLIFLSNHMGISPIREGKMFGEISINWKKKSGIFLFHLELKLWEKLIAQYFDRMSKNPRTEFPMAHSLLFVQFSLILDKMKCFETKKRFFKLLIQRSSWVYLLLRNN